MAAEAAILGTDAVVPLVHQGSSRRRHVGAGRAPRPVRAHARRNRNPALTRAGTVGTLLWRALLAALLVCGSACCPGCRAPTRR